MNQYLVLFPLLLLAGLCRPAAAQSTAPLPDSSAWRDTSPKVHHGLAVATTTDGQTVRAYFPVNTIGFEHTIDYFGRHPETRPFPRIQYVSVDKIASATIRGFHLENMRPAGCPEVLALRLIEGPVELFAFGGTAASKVPLLPAVLLPVLAMPTLLAQLGGLPIERNRWFLRRQGQLVAVTPGNFRKLMPEYTADCLAVSTQIAQGAKGFHHRDMPRIINLYNEFLLIRAAPPAR